MNDLQKHNEPEFCILHTVFWLSNNKPDHTVIHVFITGPKVAFPLAGHK